MVRKFKSLKEFYPYYLSEHDKSTTRVLHYIGTSLVSLLLVYNIIFDASLWYLLPIIGYGFAWVGHFFIEKNKPATFQYPLYSLASDFIMLFHFITFQLLPKLENARSLYK